MASAPATSTSLDRLKARLFDLNALHAAVQILEWDQQVLMPPRGGEARAEHLGILSRMHHEMFVADETARLLEDAAKEASGDDVALVRVVKRDFDLSTKIPTDLVAKKVRLSSLAHEQWVKARALNDFASFAALLSEMFAIAREEAEYLGYTDHIYDALLDQYEEGATAADCTRMFGTLKQPTIDLVKAIKAQPPIDDSKLTGDWDEGRQRSFTEFLARQIGYDFDRGRQDTAAHPFCTGWSVNDIRITTRFKPYLPSAIFGTLHESGHALYELGSPQKWDRTPLAGGVSLGIHESQSRTWENIIGRSKAFWKRYLPDLQKYFPEMDVYTADTFYRAINKVEPSFIRVEADEVTYNLHVMTRFELECDLLTGKLAVKDLPEAWNAKYTEYLGITPKTDSEGCLQDVHWSGGSIGYFPTYSMGNLLSYQIWGALKKDVGDPDALIEKGNFEPIRGWLEKHVYSQGRKYTPKDLVMRVTGKPIGADDYVSGLHAKYREIYKL